MPGNRPAKKTPDGKVFSAFDCDLVESILDESVAPVVTEDVEIEVDFEVDVADVGVDVDEESDDCALEPLKELWLINMEQYESPLDCVKQS